MSALVNDRTNRPELRDVAGRIDASQADEIKFMQEWLTDRDEPVANPKGHDGGDHMLHEMAGMASMADMKKLATLEAVEFDRLFLQLMISHHKGAVTMVDELHDQPGSAFDPVLYEFTNEIVNDQEAEIERMSAILRSLSTDPRMGLTPGLFDAGEAISNLSLVGTLKKPAGFFDPKNPVGLAPPVPSDDDKKKNKDDKPKIGDRSALLSFSNTDMAFSGDVLVAGSYHGFNIYRLNEEAAPTLVSSIVCPGGQGDVSIVGDLLIMSVEQTRGRVDCGLQGLSLIHI